MAVSRVSTPSVSTATTRAPSKKQLEKRYADFADSQMTKGLVKKLSKAPAGWDKVVAYDVSRGALGVGKHAFVIKGDLYLRTKPVRPNAQPTWYKLGTAPTKNVSVGGQGSGRSVGGQGSARGSTWSPSVGGRSSSSSRRGVGGRGSASSRRGVGGRGSASSRRGVGGGGSR